jgi:hypothetical protein
MKKLALCFLSLAIFSLTAFAAENNQVHNHLAKRSLLSPFAPGWTTSHSGCGGGWRELRPVYLPGGPQLRYLL